MEGTAGPGVDTVVLLARSTPLAAQHLDELSKSFPAVRVSRSRVSEFENGRPLLVGVDRQAYDRGPDPSKTVTIRDPVLRQQRLIMARYKPYFSLIRTMTVPTSHE